REYCSATVTPQRRKRIETTIAEVSESYTPVDVVPGRTYDVQSLVVPVLDADGEVTLVLRISQLPAGVDGSVVLGWVEALTAAARRFGAACLSAAA
ncbi:MAG: hypothetical protein J2O46_08650, partial [Nocardioides sp.]|nr:hypothetical protein [Nocardioides sp.]